MQVNVGYIQKYKSQRGFGFISQNLSESIADVNEDVFFHISKIKSRYPEIAKQLDADQYQEILLWYSLEYNEKGVCVDEVWTSFESIPSGIQKEFRDNFLLYADTLCLLLLENQNLLVIAQEILGQLEYQTWIIEKQQRSQELSEKRRKSKQKKDKRRQREAKRVFVGTFGLPKSLYDKIFRVGDPYRDHPWSTIQGGSHVIVEFTDGRVNLYDKVKYPDLYIRKFFSGYIHYPESKLIRIVKKKMSRIFTRMAKEGEDIAEKDFREVWNSTNTDITPWEALRRFNKEKEKEEDEWLSGVDLD